MSVRHSDWQVLLYIMISQSQYRLTLGARSFSVVGGYPMRSRRFSSISGIYLLDASITS